MLDTGFLKIRFDPGPDRLGLKLPDDAIIRIYSRKACFSARINAA